MLLNVMTYHMDEASGQILCFGEGEPGFGLQILPTPSENFPLETEDLTEKSSRLTHCPQRADLRFYLN